MAGLLKKLRQQAFSSIRTKMIGLFLLASLLTSIVAIFILIILNQLTVKMDDMFSENIKINEFLATMEEVDSYLTKYLVTDDSDSVLNYFIQRDFLITQASKMYEEKQDIYSEDAPIYKDIYFLVESYVEQTDAAVNGRQLDDADEYILRYGQADRISEYIKSYADKINLIHLDENTRKYAGMSKDLSSLIIANVVLIASIISFNIVLILYLSYNMTKPIVKLATSAKEIAGGNFEADDVEVYTHDELKVMANAFNAMKHSIKDYIYELHDKAETESRLLAQQIENLKMQNLLDDAELKALQAQINPHFLFNTLNAGMQLAVLEDAPKTSEFLDDLAKIFRYNVRNVDRVVTIKDELDMIMAYANLFKVRFGDAIVFKYNIDKEVLGYKVPPFIIQPLLENATIHGVGNKEDGGTIATKVKMQGDRIHITVHDDGVGMNEETKLRILEGTDFERTSAWHTTGIGIHNVLQRLKLFFEKEDMIEIISSPGNGTSVILKIPKMRMKHSPEKEGVIDV